ncbi:hypothetical protein I2F27_05205 [Acinetobacter sp. B5B]|uniref:DUF6231 family protein n=1 Tax=Acinetobacter baretiae TaxID=2605383 RepID=UPI0018C30FAC|nr:DUF6231 family protein [Acinetobacter baretiae]MBF7682732.1 hypothetical protein [Acinetobacter baretiae]
MAEQNVITSLLDDLAQEQPIKTALCVGQNIALFKTAQPIDWQYFNVSELLSLPFTQRYDLGFVVLNVDNITRCTLEQKTQLLVKLRDLLVKKLVVICEVNDQQLLRSLGFTQMLGQTVDVEQKMMLWQFNILTYKHVPDWFNSRFWANPENWDKFRW